MVEQSGKDQHTKATGIWFDDAGLGIFIHWGFISQRGYELSWPIVGSPVRPTADSTPRSIPVAEYFESVDAFSPVSWDAARVVDQIKRSGASYVVFPARHADGYNMYRSDASTFGVATSPFGRDLMNEFVTASRSSGLRIGIYYSLPDWHHTDYPAFTDADRPYPDEHWPRAGHPGVRVHRRHRRSDPQSWSRYLQYVRAQIREILTRYGRIDLLWFDGDWERTPEEWDTTGLNQLIKSLQPEILINSRLPENGDFDTPEQGLPMDPTVGRWEMCMPMGDQWGYRAEEVNVKSPRQIVGKLAQVASLGGNLLLNVSPDAEGQLPDWQRNTLAQIGDWMEQHKPSIIGARPAPSIRHYGPLTQTAEAIYAHLIHPPIETFEISGLPIDRVRSVSRLADSSPLDYRLRGEIHVQKALDERLGRAIIQPVPPSGALMDVVEIAIEPR